MRTNIHLNDELISRALELSGLRTKKSVVEEALKVYVQMLNQQRTRQFRGKLTWEGDLDASRTDR